MRARELKKRPVDLPRVECKRVDCRTGRSEGFAPSQRATQRSRSMSPWMLSPPVRRVRTCHSLRGARRFSDCLVIAAHRATNAAETLVLPPH